MTYRFQSLLLQVSFKTPAKRRCHWLAGFQSLLLQVSFKTIRDRELRRQEEWFQSLLLQVSFKTGNQLLLH